MRCFSALIGKVPWLRHLVPVMKSFNVETRHVHACSSKKCSAKKTVLQTISGYIAKTRTKWITSLHPFPFSFVPFIYHGPVHPLPTRIESTKKTNQINTSNQYQIWWFSYIFDLMKYLDLVCIFVTAGSDYWKEGALPSCQRWSSPLSPPSRLCRPSPSRLSWAPWRHARSRTRKFSATANREMA